ncbi:DNA adenine methylase [Luteimonas sp. MJ174]|uniref:DNA adenine methylase n=1 Tax=Luteimonas sp. MJ174 TaxID=3129237 RepID=UPI0031BB238F
MPVTDSPLRYPGGKTQLVPFIASLLRHNNLAGGVYAEPFAGGAGAALKLLFQGDVSEIWLNDLDRAVHALWATILREPDYLCERIRRSRVSMAEWHRQRGVLEDTSSTRQERGYAALFLNRTNRSGILKGGVIGGKQQNGTYKLDCRFNKTEIISKIERIHSYRDVITLTRHDAETCIRRWEKALPPRGLVNIDPPYYSKGRDLYLSFYEHSDHVRLAKLVKSLEVRWMLTYDDAPQIESLYSGLPLFRTSLTYYAQVKRRASEILVLSPSLVHPALPARREAA